MANHALIQGRYEVSGKPVGQGGMGVVYKAYDVVTKRPVALKSLRGALSPAALELFNKEWSVLAQVSHPNIVDVLDTGAFEEDGEQRPFFVMPFLPGATLEELMRRASPRLTVERIVGIVSQTCRGLQAAHERGVIHRDLKPSNIFIMDDDAVKIIDFGIVHLLGTKSVTGLKGTLQYMAPEQIELKPVSPASDLFSLAVVCYEALTSRKPFARNTEIETAEAIRSYIPPTICDLNPLVSRLVSRVIHKCLAKEPWHRFSSAREFAENLQKALRGEEIDRFDQAKIQPRIDRAKKAQAEGDHQFAAEILDELEAEGNIDPEMSLLRIQVDQAIRQKSVRQLLDSARTRLEENEFPLALQKIQEVLEIDPENPDALALKTAIERQRGKHQVENWFRLADQHVHNSSFGQARQALQEILKLNPNEPRAKELLQQVDLQEQEVERTRSEQEKLYQEAVGCYRHGEVSSALTKLERILELSRRSPDSTIPDREAQYQSLYNQIRSDRDAARNAYAEGQRCLSDRNFVKALEICNEQLQKSPGDPLFQALQLEAEEQQRQEQSSFIAEVSRRADAERDLDRRVSILKEAVDRCPNEPHLQQSLRLVRERRDLVNSIVERARLHEERGQFNEALSQFDILRSIYAQYPGLEFETERLKRRREAQIREEAKGRWVEQIDRQIAIGDYSRARDLAGAARAEFPGDKELAELERLAENGLKRAAEAEEWLRRGQKLCFDRQFGEGLEALRKAAELDGRNPVIREALLNALVEQARSVLGQDWRAAEPLITEALGIDQSHPLAKSLQGLVLDYKRQEILNECVTQAREMQANGNLSGALARVEEVLASYPNEVRLVQLRSTLRNLGAVSAPKPAVPVEHETPPEPEKAAAPAEPGQRARIADAVTATASVSTSGARPFTIDRSMAGGGPAAPSAPAAESPPAPLPRPAPTPVASALTSLRERFSAIKPWLRAFAAPRKRGPALQWAALALVGVALLVSIIVRYKPARTPKPVTPAAGVEYMVDVRSNVPAAQYRIDGNPIEAGSARLRAGTHTLEASALGYKTETKPFTLGQDTPAPFVIHLQLQPELARLRFTSDLKAGKIVLDGQPPVDLQEDGAFSAEAISLSTEHKFSLMQGDRELLTISFVADPGGIVNILPPVKSKDVDAVLISNLGPRARVWATDPALKAAPKDQPPQPVPPEGVEFRGLGANAELILDNGKSQRPLPTEPGNAPALAIWLATDVNLADVEIDAGGAAGGSVTIDRRAPRALRPGMTPLRLTPGRHTLVFTREGFEPSEQKVELTKGQRLRIGPIDLKPVIRNASLIIETAAGVEVLIDGAIRVPTLADGLLRIDDVQPGNRNITLRRQYYDDKHITKAFSAGQTVRISGSEAAMVAFGALDFRVSPAAATITYRRAESSEPLPAENGRQIRVSAGRYAIHATANNSVPHDDTVTVEPGKPRLIEWALAPVPPANKPAPAPPPPPSGPGDYFENLTQWTKTGDVWVHKGEGVALFKHNRGVFYIEFLRQKQGLLVAKWTKHIEWIIDRSRTNPGVVYTYDFGNLERRAIVAGKPDTNKVKAPAAGDTFAVQIDIAPERIIVRDATGKELDRWNRPDPAAALGSFGVRGDVQLTVKRIEPR